MNKLIILLTYLNINSFECNFTGKTTFVKWQKSKNEFVVTNVDIGSINYSLNIESCEKENDKLIINTYIHSKTSQSNKDNSAKFCLLGANYKEHTLDTLYIFDTRKNKFIIELKKYDNFIFKEKYCAIGTKYLIKDFK